MRQLLLALPVALLAVDAEAGPAFDPVCDNAGSLLAIGLDTTSHRTDGEIADAEALLTFLKDGLSPGRYVTVYIDTGDGTPQRVVDPICKPTPCADTHPILALLKGWSRRCTRAGFRRAQEAFSATLTAGFAPYFAKSDAPESKMFNALSAIHTDLGNQGWGRAELIYFSDGIPNDKASAPYRPGAPWLKAGTARTRLFEALSVRGALPNLSLFKIQFVGFGRPQSSGARVSSWKSPRAVNELKAFWASYSGKTGAEMSFQPTLAIDTLRMGSRS